MDTTQSIAKYLALRSSSEEVPRPSSTTFQCPDPLELVNRREVLHGDACKGQPRCLRRLCWASHGPSDMNTLWFRLASSSPSRRSHCRQFQSNGILRVQQARKRSAMRMGRQLIAKGSNGEKSRTPKPTICYASQVLDCWALEGWSTNSYKNRTGS